MQDLLWYSVNYYTHFTNEKKKNWDLARWWYNLSKVVISMIEVQACSQVLSPSYSLLNLSAVFCYIIKLFLLQRDPEKSSSLRQLSQIIVEYLHCSRGLPQNGIQGWIFKDYALVQAMRMDQSGHGLTKIFLV